MPILSTIICYCENSSAAKIRALDSPWRERFSSITLDEDEIRHVDDRLVKTKNLHASIKNS